MAATSVESIELMDENPAPRSPDSKVLDEKHGTPAGTPVEKEKKPANKAADDEAPAALDAREPGAKPTADDEALSPQKSDPEKDVAKPTGNEAARELSKKTARIIEEDHHEFSGAGFAGTVKFVREAKSSKDDSYRFEPPLLKITERETVCFRWYRPGLRVVEVGTANATEPIVVSGQRSDLSTEERQGSFFFTPQEPGEWYFAIQEPDGTATCTVVVAKEGSVLGSTIVTFALGITSICAAIVIVVVVTVLWARQQSFLTSGVSEEDDAAQYKGLETMEDIVVERGLPWILLSVLVFLALVIVRVVFCCWRSRLSDFGQGYSAAAVVTIKAWSVLLFVGLIALTLTLWWYLLAVSSGYAELFRRLNQSINDTLNEVLTVIRNLDFVISKAPELLGITIPASSTTLLTQIQQTAENIKVWSENGDNIARAVFRGLSILAFIALQAILYTAATGLAAIRERKDHLMRTAVWTLVICLSMLCMSIGVVSLTQAILEKTYETSTAFVHGQLTTQQLQAETGASRDSPLVQLFGACSEDGVLSVGFLTGVIQDAAGGWNSGQSNSSLQIIPPNTTFGTVAEFSDFADYLDRQLEQIDQILENDPAAFASTIPQFRANTAPVLRAAVSVGKSLLGLVNCRLLRDALGDLMPTLKIEVIDKITWQLNIMYAMLAIAVLLVGAGSVAAHVFARPLKFWNEPVTDRWFRFRACWSAHRRVIKRYGVPSETPYWEEPPCCTLAAYVSAMYELSIINAVMVCLQAVLMIILHYSYEDNQLDPLLQVAAFCCATAPFIAMPAEIIDWHVVRILLRLVNLCVMIAAASLAIIFAVRVGEDSNDCYNEIEAQRSSNSSLYPFTANCSLDHVVRGVEQGVYASTVGIVCLVSIVVMVSLLICHRTRSTSSLHGELDEREVEEVAKSRRRREVRKLLSLLFIATLCAVVVAIVLAGLVFAAFGTAPESKPNTFRITTDAFSRCNGYTSNCERRVDDAIFPTSHNSFSSLARRFIAPNHYYDFEEQLNSGIRGFMIDIWPSENTSDPTSAYLCHKYCNLGSRRLVEEMTSLQEFLVKHPREVVVLHIEQYANTSQIVTAFAEANLDAMLWVPDSSLGTPESNSSFLWPTLQELITLNQRVLVFTDTVVGHPRHPSPAPSWMLYMWHFWVESDYAVATASAFDCRYRRGNSTAAAVRRKATVLNHFLTAPLGAPFLASTANARASLLGHFGECRTSWSHVPNLVALDFWSIGEPLRTIDGMVGSL